MAIGVRQGNYAEVVATPPLTVTLPLATLAGSILMVGGWGLASTAISTITFTDGSGDTYTDSGLGFIDDSASGFSFKFASRVGAFLAPTAGTTTVIINHNGTGATLGSTVFAYEITGLVSPALDKSVTAQSPAGAADSGSTGTLTSANEIAVGVIFSASASTAIGAGWSSGGTNITDGVTPTFGSVVERQITAATTGLHATSASSGRWRATAFTAYDTAVGGFSPAWARNRNAISSEGVSS